MKVLFVSTRRAKPSFRFRVEQMLPWFEARGHQCDVEFLPSSVFSRWSLYRRLPAYDVVFWQKRLLNRAELYLIRQRAKRLVYDLDDAVMFNGRGEPSRRLTRFRTMVLAADLVICGNTYLAGHVLRYSNRVQIVPTAIDTEKYHPRLRSRRKLADSSRLIIGWTGSRSTNAYLNAVLPVLPRLSVPVEFRFLSDTKEGVDLNRLGGVPFRFIPWSPEVEIQETAAFDVGIMPLPDDPWTRGKCGFKALQYLGLGIPAVCSPVGVNCDIITSEVHGLLAGTSAEWFDCLNRLATDDGFRRRLGEAGRQRIEQAFALNVQAPRLVDALEDLTHWERRTA